MVQKQHDDSTISASYFSLLKPKRGWHYNELDNGWTIFGYIESDDFVSCFSAICEDGTVDRAMDGSIHSTSEAVFDTFLETFKLQ